MHVLKVLLATTMKTFRASLVSIAQQVLCILDNILVQEVLIILRGELNPTLRPTVFPALLATIVPKVLTVNITAQLDITVLVMDQLEQQSILTIHVPLVHMDHLHLNQQVLFYFLNHSLELNH